LPAFTFGGVGDGLPNDIEHFLKDRHLVILADNDKPGATHAQKKAARARDSGAASIKDFHFPELPPKGDVSDFLANGGTAEQLLTLIDALPEWPPADSSIDAIAPSAEQADEAQTAEATPANQDAEREIQRLAALSLMQYERQRTAVAEQLGVRTSILDAAVRAARPTEAKGQGRAFELPSIEPWPSRVDGAELLNEISDAIGRYIVMSPESKGMLALWALHTHCFNCFAHSPRLAITSPEKGCGKTTALDVLGCLVARPLPTTNATAAAIFRIVEIAAPTLLSTKPILS
jgi:hypothetical protein